MPIRIVADLEFSVRDPKRPRAEPVVGRVQADGVAVVVEFSTTPSLLGLRSRAVSGAVAEFLHREGLTLRVHGPSGLVVSVGREAAAPFWQRVVTGTRHARLGSLRALAGSLRGPHLLDAALPELAPQPSGPKITVVRRLLRRLGPKRG